MRKRPIHVTRAQGKPLNTLCIKNEQNVQNYYNGKCAKYLMFDLKKYRGVIFHDTEELCKF